MIKLYRDSVSAANLINSDLFLSIDKEQLLFSDVFKLGSTPCLCVKVKAVKGVLGTFNTLLIVDDSSGTDTLKATLEVDEQNTDDDVYDTFTLVDYMIRFNVTYNAFHLMPESDPTILNYPTLLQVFQDICSTCNVSTDVTSFAGYDKIIGWYDSTISARDYIGYIAELNGGFAYITPEGKLAFKQFSASNSAADTIPVANCDSFKLGQHFTVKRVLYDDNDGTSWEYGDDTGSTVYLRTANVYITDTTDVQVIYNIIKDFDFYNITVGKCPIGTAEIGDLVSFTLDGNAYNTITQIKQSYNNGWIGGYECKVESQEQQETTVRDNTTQQIRTIRTNLDYMNNEFSRIVQQIDTLDDTVSSQQTTIVQNSESISLIASEVQTIQDDYATQTEMDSVSGNVSDLDEQINGENGIATTLSVLASGVQVTQTTEGSYTRITDNGMEIYVNNQLQAYATTEGFNASTFLTGDWHIQPANNGNSLNFFKKGNS